MDYRSLYLHFECGVYMYKCKCISDIKKDVLETISSKEFSKKTLMMDEEIPYKKQYLGYLHHLCNNKIDNYLNKNYI